MKVYVAGKFEDKERVRALMEKLLANQPSLGILHTITHDWTTEEELKTPWDDGSDQERTRPDIEDLSQAVIESHTLAVHTHHQLCAQADYQGVIDCDVLVFLVQANCKGAYVELGVALALGKKVIVVLDRTKRAFDADSSRPAGDPMPSCIFFQMPGVIVTDSDDKVVDLVNRLTSAASYTHATGVKTNPR